METKKRSKLFWPALSYPHDFCIVIDGERYYTHKIVVFSLSSKIFQEAKNAKKNGIIFKEYVIQDCKDSNHYFRIINDYFHGKNLLEIGISRENAPFIVKVGRELDLTPLVSEACKYIEQLTIENCIKQMELFSSCYVENYPCAELIADNWNVFSKNKDVLNLSVFAFEQIFDCLPTTENESQLFSFIEKLVKIHGRSYASLFSLVSTASLGTNEINRMINYTEYDSLDSDLIEAFKERLLLDISFEEEEDQEQKMILYSPGNEFNGIFSLIKREYGNAWVNNVLINCGAGNRPENVLDYNMRGFNNYWENYDSSRKYQKSSAWISFFFPSKSIMLKSYVMMCDAEQSDTYQPRDWDIYASKDGKNWDLIDSQVKADTNRNRPMICTQVNSGNEDFYQYFKLHLNSTYSKLSMHKYHFRINAIEFFGAIHDL